MARESAPWFDSHMSQKTSIESMMVLGFAGLFSALLIICSPRIPNRVGDIDYLLPGGLFGVALSVSLWWRKILKGLWKMLAITAAASIAFPIAALLCVGFEYFGPWPLHSPGKGFGDLSNAALFVGGTVGSFLICIASFCRCRSTARGQIRSQRRNPCKFIRKT